MSQSILAIQVSSLHRRGAAVITTHFPSGAAAAHSRGAATAIFLADASVAPYKGAALTSFLAGAFVLTVRMWLPPIFYQTLLWLTVVVL